MGTFLLKNLKKFNFFFAESDLHTLKHKGIENYFFIHPVTKQEMHLRNINYVITIIIYTFILSKVYFI